MIRRGVALSVVCAAVALGTAQAQAPGLPAWSLPRLVDHAALRPLNFGLVGVSCPSVTLCVAVDDDAGGIVTGSTPAAAAGWRVTRLSHVTTRLSGVSCPSAALCVAVGYPGVVTSTDPLGGAGAWNAARLPGSSGATGVSCPSVSLCVAVGNFGNEGTVLTSSNPAGGTGAWQSAQVGSAREFLTGVSCPSPTLCVAVGDKGTVLTSANPTAGRPAWTSANVGNVEPGGLTAVSCPSPSLCVAVDGSGQVLTSTNPTGGAGAWRATRVDPSVVLQSVACPSVSLCVAGDNGGGVVASTNPTGGRSAWTFTSVDGTNTLHGISCPSTSLCIAVDSSGNVVTGSPTAVSLHVPRVVKTRSRLAGDTVARRHGRELRVKPGLAVICPAGGPACTVSGAATATDSSTNTVALPTGRVRMRVPAGARRDVFFDLQPRAARLVATDQLPIVTLNLLANAPGGGSVGDNYGFDVHPPPPPRR
ncbi:MAG: hypothetical protein LC685_01535 [Actinobacteria bacterium]|nr:hypothetical protein [Actinomycetota bacterium]